MLAVCSGALVLGGQTPRMAKEPAFVVRRPTIIAFFPVTPQALENEPDTNEALSDFQFYTAQARKPLLEMGVDLEEVYGRSFRVTNSRKTTTFRPTSGKIGYYFVSPSKRP